MNLRLSPREARTLLALLQREATDGQAGDREGRAHMRRVGRVGLRLCLVMNAGGAAEIPFTRAIVDNK